MALQRVDKTESAIGVTRGTLAADIAVGNFDKAVGVGVDANGNIVVGAGTSGIIGVIIANKTNNKAGSRCDIFGNGSEIVGIEGVLAKGIPVYALNADGTVSGTSAAGTLIGFTVGGTSTRDTLRLVVTI